MMIIKKKKLSNAEVTEFLVLNPDFFKDNPEVLNSIEIVHESGGAVSLIQRQIELLRSDYKSTTNQLLEILGVAKSNENIFSLTKRLILSLIETSSLEEMVLILEKGFESDFGAKKSRLLFFTEFSKDLPKGRIRNPSEATRILGNLLKPGAVYCGEMNKGVSSFIFGNKPKIKESALVPLSCKSLTGLIALGTDEIGKYDSKKDSLFLDFIAEVVSKLIDSHNA